MKKYLQISMITLFSLVAAKASATVTGGKSGDNDSTTNLKSNIVIFKMMTGTTTSGNNGSLKKAGKVARTSNSQSSVKNPPALPSEG
jgi:hypothetical protein